jgi:serine protease
MTRGTGDGVSGRRRFGRVAVLGAATLLGLVAATGIASASTQTSASTQGSSTARATVARSGVMSFGGAASVAPAAASDLVYGGGFIQDHPAVFLVFWGSQWASDTNGVQSYVTKFFQGLGTSSDAWSRVTSQYTGQGGSPTFTGSVLKGTWVDSGAAAPSRASASAIAAEARKAAAHFGTSGHNASVIVMSPHGTHPDGFPNGGFCAWHSATGSLPYTNMPYVLDAGTSCGQNSVGGRLDGFSIVAGHEYLEVVTDPIPPSGWVDRSGAENADKCAWQNLHKINLPTGSFAVQPTWSNKVHGCAG